MSLKSTVASRVLERMLSPERRRRNGEKWERRRRRRGDDAVIDYFHQSDDPYSHLMLQLLPQLRERYPIDIRPWLVGPPPDWAAPERGMLVVWSRHDAAGLAARHGLSFEDLHRQPHTDGPGASTPAAMPA